MARMGTAQRQAIGQANTTNTEANNLTSGTTIPAITSLIQNPGLTPEQQSAQTQETMGGIGAAFGNASDAANRTAARTNNPAGVQASLDKLAQSKGQTAGNQAEKNVMDNATFARQGLLSGINAANGLTGTLLGTGASNLGTGTRYAPPFSAGLSLGKLGNFGVSGS